MLAKTAREVDTKNPMKRSASHSFRQATITGLLFFGIFSSRQSRSLSRNALNLLQNNLQMSDAITIIRNSPDRASSSRYLRQQSGLSFVTTQRQDPMVLDGYAVLNINSPIIGYSLFYNGPDGSLAFLDASVNPLNVPAAGGAARLVSTSFDTVDNPDGSTLHYIGDYDLGSGLRLRIMVRWAGTPVRPEYNIRYAVAGGGLWWEVPLKR